jgi:hypothetical protein
MALWQKHFACIQFQRLERKLIRAAGKIDLIEIVLRATIDAYNIAVLEHNSSRRVRAEHQDQVPLLLHHEPLHISRVFFNTYSHESSAQTPSVMNSMILLAELNGIATLNETLTRRVNALSRKLYAVRRVNAESVLSL